MEKKINDKKRRRVINEEKKIKTELSNLSKEEFSKTQQDLSKLNAEEVSKIPQESSKTQEEIYPTQEEIPTPQQEISTPQEEIPQTIEVEYSRYQQLLEAESQRDEYVQLLKRLKADFENYKKRNHQELQYYIKMANKQLIQQLLVILDNFAYALNCNDTSSVDSIKEGVKLINKQLFEILKENGLNKIEALSRPFDLRYHEVIVQEPDDSVAPGTIIKVLRDGYTLYDEVIRPAQVAIAKGGVDE